MGVGHSLIYGQIPVIISKWFSKRRVGLAVGVGTAGAGVGTVYLGRCSECSECSE
jgi:hypothetical protein